MGIYQNQVIQEKEVFLKKISKFYLFALFIIAFSTAYFLAPVLKAVEVKGVLEYIYNTKEFSSKFIQVNQDNVSEGSLYLKDDRIKLIYRSPTKIELTISKKKAMYFNVDLEEVEYFNPKKTMVFLFYDIFNNKDFFKNAIFKTTSDQITLKKKIKIEGEDANIEIILENNPLVIKKIIINYNENLIKFNIVSPNFNPKLDKKFFSMIDPRIKK